VTTALTVAPPRHYTTSLASGPVDVQAAQRLRAYLQLGARVCGRPAYDPAFGTADLYLLLAVSDVPARVLDRLLGGAR